MWSDWVIGSKDQDLWLVITMGEGIVAAAGVFRGDGILTGKLLSDLVLSTAARSKNSISFCSWDQSTLEDSLMNTPPFCEHGGLKMGC